MKLLKAVETDNFETDPESQGRAKRRKKIPKHFDDSSSESDTQRFLPSPPRIKQQKTKNLMTEVNSSLKKKCNKFVLKKPSGLGNISRNSVFSNTSPKWISAKPTSTKPISTNTMKDKQCDISDGYISPVRMKYSTVSQINHPNYDFDNANYNRHSPILSEAQNMEDFNSDSNFLTTSYIEENRQIRETQMTNYTEKNSHVDKLILRSAAREVSSVERSPNHHTLTKNHHPISSNNMKG